MSLRMTLALRAPPGVARRRPSRRAEARSASSSPAPDSRPCLPGGPPPRCPRAWADDLRGAPAPPRRGDTDSPRPPHAVPPEDHLEGAADFFSPPHLAKVAVERLARREPQALDCSGMGPDDVRHVPEGESHLRRHVAGWGSAEARQFCRVPQPPPREASDETKGNHPGEGVVEDPPVDEV